MKFFLTRDEMVLLNLFVREPSPQMESIIKQYSVTDQDVAKQVIRLRKWLEAKVFEPLKTDPEKPDRITGYNFPERRDVGLKQVYLERLLDILKHYEPVGRQIGVAHLYYPLLWKLKGESVAEDDPSE